jgi:hypothetical protein
MFLKEEEKDFMSENDLNLVHVFDAKGMRLKEYRQIMKDFDKILAINTTPCRKSGHTMRTKEGSCMLCNPLNLVYSRRYHSKGYVYIAGTLAGEKIKIGFSKDPNERERSLNRTSYGEYFDWKILYFVGLENAGLIEDKLSKKLKKFFFQTEFIKDNRLVATMELYRCSYSVAKKELDSLDKKICIKPIEKTELIDLYEFTNLESDGMIYLNQKKELKEYDDLVTKKITTKNKKLSENSNLSIENILSLIKKSGRIKAKNIAKEYNVSRKYINNILYKNKMKDVIYEIDEEFHWSIIGSSGNLKSKSHRMKKRNSNILYIVIIIVIVLSIL